MALLRILSKVFNTLLPFSDFMYILQQEEYSSARLVKWLPRFFLRRNFQKRDHLRTTKRVKITLGIILVLWIGTLILAVLAFNQLIARLILVAVWMLLVPVFVLVGNWFSFPYFEMIKTRIRKQAVAKVKAQTNLKVVAVAGSYGKTTVKNFIYQLVRFNYQTQMIPGNINTPAGIAAWVNTNLQSNTELLVVEVDAYEVGEIAKSCEVVAPDIAVLTNVGDQHLERFGGNVRELARALSEVITNAKSNARLVTNAETADKLAAIGVMPGAMDVINSENAVQPKSDYLSRSNMVNLQYAVLVAKNLNIPAHFIEDTVEHLELPDRRQKQMEMYGYDAIDDSYNISFTTAQAGLVAARSAADKAYKKLLVIAAGIPELSADNRDKNVKLGEIIGRTADAAVVLGSIFAQELLAGIGDKGKLYPDLLSFLAVAHREYPPTEWFLLMEPELGDLYY